MVNSPSKPSAKIQAPLVSSQDLGWESIIVEEFQQPSGSSISGYWKEHAICLSLTTCRNHIWEAINNRSHIGVYTKGDITIIPAKLPSSYRSYGDDQYLQIRIPPQFLKLVATPNH